jgi:hypothetical protein
MCCWIAWGVLKKKRCDFVRLKEVPVASLKSERMELSLLASCVVGVLMSMVSSTNWLCEAAGWSPWRGRPCKEPLSMEDFM